MTARAFPDRVLGRALQQNTLRMTEQETQRLLVLVGPDGISPQLAMMCQSLDIEVIEVVSHHDLPFRLHHHRPIGVVSELNPCSPASCAGLRSIASYDPAMPVLLVTNADPTILGTLDAAEQLWGLSCLERIADPPSVKDLMRFLFQAGRRLGHGRLLPVG